MKKGYLILENGQVFEGVRFGADGTAQGELVFNTSMVGYEGTITDGCNYGKILMHTFPQVGNYGMIGEDVDGPATPCAFVCREYCASPSNFRSEGDLDAYLSEQGVVGLQGVDTRELTRILRDNGSMNAMIADEVPADLTGLKEYKLTGAVAALTYGDVTYHSGTLQAFDLRQPPRFRHRACRTRLHGRRFLRGRCGAGTCRLRRYPAFRRPRRRGINRADRSDQSTYRQEAYLRRWPRPSALSSGSGR